MLSDKRIITFKSMAKRHALMGININLQIKENNEIPRLLVSVMRKHLFDTMFVWITYYKRYFLEGPNF